MKTYDSLIIGGGFFGMAVAEHLARKGQHVLLCEREAEFMRRASYHNQARVHNGYHYPRSVLTALRSRVSFPRFCQEFGECIDQSFSKYYLIGRPLGKVTARQFAEFIRRIGAPCKPAPPHVAALTNPRTIEACFETEEYAFDASVLRDIMIRRLNETGVESRLQTTVERCRRVSASNAPGFAVNVQSLHDCEEITCRQVFNCTYASLNEVLQRNELKPISLKHELTEICLFEPPDELVRIGLTVMCGPFFSAMPFPARGLHSLSHVRYTPHSEWSEPEHSALRMAGTRKAPAGAHSHWRHMVQDAKRFVPAIERGTFRESLWEIKTVLPRSESDDSRPILFKPHYGMRGFHSLMGGKIDNIYDVIDAISRYGLAVNLVKHQVIEGWTSLVLIISFFFTLLFIILSIIGEYVARILDERSDQRDYTVLLEKHSRVMLDENRLNVLADSSERSPNRVQVGRDS